MPKKGSKPRGPMSPYACFVHICREEVRREHPNESVRFGQFSQICGQRWQTMTDEQKEFFQRLSEIDHERYKNELKNHPKNNPQANKKKNKTGSSERKRSRTEASKKGHDSNLPVKPLKAFYWFCKFERPNVKEANQNLSGGHITRELGRMWRKLDQSLKKSYDMMADVDKTRYEEELEALQKQENKGKSKSQQKASSPNKRESVEIASRQSSEEDEDENDGILIEIINSDEEDDDDWGKDKDIFREGPAKKLQKVYYENAEEEKAEPELPKSVYVEEDYDDDVIIIDN